MVANNPAAIIGQENVEIELECTHQPQPRTASTRSAEVALDFGLPLTGQAERVLDHLTVRLGPGRILAFAGPSGSGKSTALNLISQKLRDSSAVDRVSFRRDQPIIDAVCPHDPLPRALEMLSACGLGEARLWLRTIDELSEGQRFRARLAKAVGRRAEQPSAIPLICDEFGAKLHRRLAAAIANNLRKLVSRHNVSLALATTDETLLRHLRPDTTVRLQGRGQSETREQDASKRPTAITRSLRIEPGRKRNYNDFATMHYRATDELGFVDKVFVARERAGGDIIAIVVYSHGPLELHLRNRATNRRFLRNPNRLNREMRILRRLVVHPDMRGCGVGHWLVKKTLPQVGTPYVECLAAMGQVNPVFEKAGMKRIGVCPRPPEQVRILDELQKLGVDPAARSFVMQVCRRPRIRRLVADLVYRWYRTTTADGENRVQRQSPIFLAHIFRSLVGARPVYYLWQRPNERKSRRRRIATADDARCNKQSRSRPTIEPRASARAEFPDSKRRAPVSTRRRVPVRDTST